MSVRGSFLRILLVGFLLGTVLLGHKFGSAAGTSQQENNPVGWSLSFLNQVFKDVGWLITIVVWALLLCARYWRQHCLQENASWKRHAGLDIILWIVASLYWGCCVQIFQLIVRNYGHCDLNALAVADNEQSCVDAGGMWSPFDISGHAFLCALGICLLVEEVIRFIGEPVYYFTLHTDTTSEQEAACITRAKLYWWSAVGMAGIVVASWSILYVRTAFFYHTIKEKLLGVAIGCAYWTGVVLCRFLILYS